MAFDSIQNMLNTSDNADELLALHAPSTSFSTTEKVVGTDMLSGHEPHPPTATRV